MSINFQSKPTLQIYGFSPESPKKLLSRVLAGAKPSSLKGDFILIAEGTEMNTEKPLTLFISTVVCAIPYYYCLTELHCVHSTNVFDCCRSAGLSWAWNWDSLAQLALFDHVLGNASLHSDISKIPPASILTICGGKVKIYTEPFWSDLYKSKTGHPNSKNASSILLDILSEIPDNLNYSLSMSAGYDSRVLLACISHLNKNAEICSMGHINSTDSRIAKELAEATGYNFKRIEIVSNDYITHSDDILKITSGEKTIWHWHTGIYTKKVLFDRASIHLTGSNGEFARSYYFDKGFFSTIMDQVHFTRWDYFLSLKNSAYRRLEKKLRNAIDPKSLLSTKLRSSLQVKSSFIPNLEFGEGLDIFYARERVRNFIGSGMALYRSKYTTMSPFLDARFIRYAAAMSRHQKLNNRYHKMAISSLRPDLLDFPTDESGTTMRSNTGWLYFLKNEQMIGYNCYKNALKIPKIKEWAILGFKEVGGNEKLLDLNKINLEDKGWCFIITIGALTEFLNRNGFKFT